MSNSKTEKAAVPPESKFRPPDIARIIGTATPGGPTSLDDIGLMAADSLAVLANQPAGPARDAASADASQTIQDVLTAKKD